MSSVQTNRSLTDRSVYITNRTAIDPRGCLGSLYDAYHDRLLEQICTVDQRDSYASRKLLRCEIIHGNNDRNQNLLRLLNIDEQLRLSILLKLVPRHGVAAIIDYPYPINTYTRLLYYSYANRRQQLPTQVEDARQRLNVSVSQVKGTHLISSIDWGIDMIVVLQLPTDTETRKQIDYVLKKTFTCLYSNYSTSSLVSDEENLLKQILQTKVYSNIPDLSSLTTLLDVCRYIEQYKNRTVNYPISYHLRPIQWFYPQYTDVNGIFTPLSSDFNDNLEQYVVHLTTDVRVLERFLHEKIPTLLKDRLKEQYSLAQKQWLDVDGKYTSEIDRLSRLIVDVRNRPRSMLTIKQAFPNHEEIAMQNCIRQLTGTLKYLEEKAHFIDDLTEQMIEYYDTIELDVEETDDLRTIEHKLIIDDQCDRILCSTDTLNKTSPSQLNKLIDDLLVELQDNPDLRLLYADFSDSPFHLPNMMIFPSNKYDNEKNLPKQLGAPIPSKQQLAIVRSPSNETINVLLLGETGVGKSTLVNAFLNYLTFKTFEQAQSEIPVAVIRTSFVLTVNDNLDKRTVKFGDDMNFNNEDFDHSGQSVTQKCQSFVFHLGHSTGRKLRLIDTPGFGDIRGTEQDNRSMQYILEYVYNLSHLNAICFLFKSNALHLHPFFRSALTQLLSFLHPNARKNILFCFTNGRSTFYMPGDTTPLLRNILSTSPEDEIPFEEENTFCFDNEAFRYLVAQQNRIPFSDHEKQECAMSWSTSVTELHRFLAYISKNLLPCQISHQSQSIKHAQLEIVYSIDPMLETMRNILRNLVLWNMDSPKKSIELRPKLSDRPIIVCRLCKPNPQRIGHFWIGNPSLHEIEKDCRTCRCPAHQHVSKDYMSEYVLLNNSSMYERNQLKGILDHLCQASVEFCYFLVNVARSSRDDPFLLGLRKMIAEETYLTENQEPNYLNLQLVNDLQQLRSKYEKRTRHTVHNDEEGNLSDIYSLIQTIQAYPMVREQILAAKNGRKIMMRQQECEIAPIMKRTSIANQNSVNT